jgi:indole-3-glycerol phosphate synthase
MSGADFLHSMAASSRARVRVARLKETEAALLERARAAPPPPSLELGGFDVIAEIKRRSPASGGLVDAGFNVDRQLEAYAEGGAAAVSVLTEPERFDGKLEHLADAAQPLAAYGLPAMRKDFLTEPYQVLEARAAGAGGVLVIVTMLDDAQAMDLVQCAHELNMFVLLEGFDLADLERMAALDLGRAQTQTLAGVNCRNLKDLQVDFERFKPLAAALPPGLPAVAESGIDHAGHIEIVAELGFSVALVGSALMRADDPQARLAEFIARGRQVRGEA